MQEFPRGWIPETIQRKLDKAYGKKLVTSCHKFGISVITVREDQTYADVSPINAANPFANDSIVNGVYIRDERTCYVRNPSDGTLIHEFAHALDHAAGDHVFKHRYAHESMAAYGQSDATNNIYAAYLAAKERNSFVSEYAAYDFNEYYAESVRAYLNAPNFPGDDATREKLRRIDSDMHEHVQNLLNSSRRRKLRIAA